MQLTIGFTSTAVIELTVRTQWLSKTIMRWIGLPHTKRHRVHGTCEVQSVELQKSHGAVPQSAADAGLLAGHAASGAARPSWSTQPTMRLWMPPPQVVLHGPYAPTWLLHE